MRQRALALRDTILGKQIFMLNYEFLKKKKQKLSFQVSNLSDVKKDFITDCFINLAKCDFRKKFLQWFLDTRVQDPEKAQEV